MRISPPLFLPLVLPASPPLPLAKPFFAVLQPLFPSPRRFSTALSSSSPLGTDWPDHAWAGRVQGSLARSWRPCRSCRQRCRGRCRWGPRSTLLLSAPLVGRARSGRVSICLQCVACSSSLWLPWWCYTPWCSAMREAPPPTARRARLSLGLFLSQLAEQAEIWLSCEAHPGQSHPG